MNLKLQEGQSIVEHLNDFEGMIARLSVVGLSLMMRPECNDSAQPCRYCPLLAQGALTTLKSSTRWRGAHTTLKRVYEVERSPYLYSARKFLPYPMWDVTNTPHGDRTSSLCHIPHRIGEKLPDTI